MGSIFSGSSKRSVKMVLCTSLKSLNVVKIEKVFTTASPAFVKLRRGKLEGLRGVQRGRFEINGAVDLPCRRPWGGRSPAAQGLIQGRK